MAAIDLTRLNQQIDHLADFYGDPAAFQQEFHTILSFYHRYSHRKHKDAMPKSFMRNYDLPEKVLSHLEARLKTLPREHPEETLRLIEQLWSDSYYEARKLATNLAGNLPDAYSSSVLTLMEGWLRQPLDRAVVAAIFKNANRTLLQTSPEQWKNLVRRLLLDNQAQNQKMGLMALADLISRSQTDELPAYYRWVREFLVSSDGSLDRHLGLVVKALAQNSQQETVYLLREVLADSNDAHVGRRIRTYLEFFDEPCRIRISAAIKNQVILPGKDTPSQGSG